MAEASVLGQPEALELVAVAEGTTNPADLETPAEGTWANWEPSSDRMGFLSADRSPNHQAGG